MKIFDLLPSIGRITVATGINYALASGVRHLLSQYSHQTSSLSSNLTKSIYVDYLLYGSIAMAIVDEIIHKSSDPDQKPPIVAQWKKKWHHQHDPNTTNRPY